MLRYDHFKFCNKVIEYTFKCIIQEEEEDLTEAFKIRIGLIKKEDTLAGIHEVEQMNEVEKDATLSKFKFKKFVETCYNSKLLSFSKEPIKEPVLNHNRDDSSEENVLNLVRLFYISLKMAKGINLSRGNSVIK